jgi:putative ABC transport system permease protein
VRFADILVLALSALRQQKVRTTLTLLGVIFGTFTLVASVSIGFGVYEAAVNQFRQLDQLRRINVWPQYTPESETDDEEMPVLGEMSETKRARIRRAMRRLSVQTKPIQPQVPLNRVRIETLAHLPHVESAVPAVSGISRATFDHKSEEVPCTAVPPDERHFRARLIAGDFVPAQGRGCLVHEYLLYKWGVTRDEDVEAVLGKTIRLELLGRPYAPALLLQLLNVGPTNLTSEQSRVLEKALRQLPGVLDRLELTEAEAAVLKKILQTPPRPGVPPVDVVAAEDFTIVGVFREYSEEEEKSDRGWFRFNQDALVLLTVPEAVSLFSRPALSDDDGFNQVTVTVDAEEHVQEVADAIRGMKLEVFSMEEAVRRVRLTVLLISFTMAFIAGVALLVACLGITNTMIMSVLERTHEIGVMKAVGARDRHVVLIFLVEGALIGFLGGAIGLLLSWAASFPGDGAARAVMEQQTGAKVEQSLFVFPMWLVVGIPLFTSLVTTLAAVYPARRAARVNPITALRHE